MTRIRFFPFFLIIFGILLLLSNLEIINFWTYVPVFLIALGLIKIINFLFFSE